MTLSCSSHPPRDPSDLLYAATNGVNFLRRFFAACARSYCDCIPVHSSGLVPRTSERRNARSAEIPTLPFRMRESDARVTPRCRAAAVTVAAPRYSRSTNPGCGGVLICILSVYTRQTREPIADSREPGLSAFSNGRRLTTNGLFSCQPPTNRTFPASPTKRTQYKVKNHVRTTHLKMSY